MTADPTSQPLFTVRVFSQRFSSTPRGARLARHLAVAQLDVWGIPHGTHVSEAVALIVGELAANAVTHGRVAGRDFELKVALIPGSVRIEVTDTRTGCRPLGPDTVRPPLPLDERGRGLMLVDAVAARWEVVDREPPPGKTVRAEVDVPQWRSLHRRAAARADASVGRVP
ncbi:ATP-binding protein [Streptomyces sp. NPDC086091]|uniref:ATP-binding protein n=1 Tax=Streptomyces sp. NPDC086091 TaxID=3365751 RepID=UPI0038188E02